MPHNINSPWVIQDTDPDAPTIGEILYPYNDNSTSGEMWRVRNGNEIKVAFVKCNYAATAAPTTGDDADDGYCVGSIWVDITNDNAYICEDNTVAAAVWAQIDGTGGSSLPVDDTTSLVQDPGDNTKQIRMDAGNIATSTVRVLTMPDADVDLKKNNYAATTAPATSNDDSEGYAVGSIWIDTTNDNAYICEDASTGAAVWAQIDGTGGSSLPVDDTTSLVQDPGDNTKQIRMDAGNIATSTVRVLTMPDADVDLKKNNYAASAAPTVDNDIDEGYTVGSIWIDTTNGNIYQCEDNTDGAAVWLQLNNDALLPVDDTTSLVQDPVDNTKQIRMDAGNIATSNVRVLTMPDADVDLKKNNYAASVAPDADNDVDEGYDVGSVWIDTTNGNIYQCEDNTDGAAVWLQLNGGGGSGLYASFAILADVKSTGTDGGSASATSWQQRDLNTELSDDDSIVAIASNQFTPVLGDYKIHVYASAYQVQHNRLRLYNVTGTAVVQEGIAIATGGGSSTIGALAHLHCTFTANGTDAYRIDHYTHRAQATTGLGLAVDDGSSEIFMIIVLEKLN